MCQLKANIISIFILLVFIVLGNMECDFVFAGEVFKCMETEREALLKFKEGLNKTGMLSSWGRGNECCKWEGIQCTNITITGLNVLNLSRNDFGGNKFSEFICSLSQLQHLTLSSSNFSGPLPLEIGNLTNLRTLDLSNNSFSGPLPLEIGNLTNLRTLDLSNNSFSGTLPSEIGNLINLRTLNLSHNHFSGILPSEIGNLINLLTLDLSFNRFSGTVPPHLWSLTNLRDLDLSRNDLTSSATDTLFNMTTNHVAPNLRTLNLRENKLKRLPSSIWQFSMLEQLRVSFNYLEDTITEADLAKLHNLKALDLSFNSLTLNISSDWTPPFQLSEICLSGCNVGPHFPSWLRTQSSFWSIDISNGGVADEVPNWFWNLSHEVTYLNLSNNNLSGVISDFSSINIEFFDVSTNNFSGPMPSLSTSTRIFQISQNMFSGSFSFMCSVPYQYLGVLDLSNNQLEGKLPDCWEKMTNLLILNLANNNFSGEIPHALGYLLSLENLYLGNNNFFGELPSTLRDCKQLQIFDIGDNMLTGSIPTWIGEYHNTMVFLILHGNMFHGSIPPQICYLSRIQVLDLSGNNISGKIPPCFNNFTHLVEDISNEITPLFIALPYNFAEFIEYATVFWKRTESEYRKNLRLLKLIDLSRNRLVGDIPTSSFSSLRELHSFNLSGNRLTGIIDPGIGQMRALESLDLSSNQLSGLIPDGITHLNFLSVLDFSNNNFSGRIPTGSQLQLFTTSTYAGNIGLCGSPLQPCLEDSPNTSTNNEDENVDEEDDDGLLSQKEFVISIILGFFVGFWGVVGPLIVNESWRRRFYDFVGDCGEWLSVGVAVFWRNLRRSS